MSTLRRVAGKVPVTAYVLCAVEFAERASFLGVKQVFSNFVNRPLPVGGNGAGAPPKGTEQTAGALGKGTVVAAAVTSSFGFLVYALPILGGWLADAKWGRFKTIAVGIAICGVSHGKSEHKYYSMCISSTLHRIMLCQDDPESWVCE